jgi:hypothetical protein
METQRSSETSVLTRAARRNIPEDGIPHSHRRENLESYIHVNNTTLHLKQLRNTRVNCFICGSLFGNNKTLSKITNVPFPQFWPSSVGTLAAYRLGRPGSIRAVSRPTPGLIQPPIKRVPGDLSPAVKQQVDAVYHSPPSCAVVKKGRSWV